MIALLVVSALITLSSGEIRENSLKRAIRETGFNLKQNVNDPGKGSFENCGKLVLCKIVVNYYIANRYKLVSCKIVVSWCHVKLLKADAM